MAWIKVEPGLVLASCKVDNYAIGDLAGELVGTNRCFAQTAFGYQVALCPACNWLLNEYERIARNPLNHA